MRATEVMHWRHQGNEDNDRTDGGGSEDAEGAVLVEVMMVITADTEAQHVDSLPAIPTSHIGVSVPVLAAPFQSSAC